jgi:GTP-binding protein HflX
MLPRLTRAWTHLSKQYGGIGTKGPGETQIETDRRIIRDRISHLKENLVKIEAHRSTQSAGRKDLTKLALVGYTNVGKSTLFNLLTNAGVFAEDKLFATLDSTTRSFALGSNRKFLISDTVGFIRKLPHHLVASFKSTLNEVRDADIILHIIDLSHQYYEDHISVVEQTMKDLHFHSKKIIRVFNKVDAVSNKHLLDYVKNKYADSVIISAKKGINVSSLNDKVLSFVEEAFVNEDVVLPVEKSRIAAKIHELADVLSTRYDEDKILISYRTKKENSEKIKKMIHGK